MDRFACSVLFLLASTVAAQRTWIVDLNNGKNTDFTTVSAAVKAAADGDLIDVRPGYYAETFNIAKALTIRGTAPGVAIHAKVGRYVPPLYITIHKLPAGKAVAFRGMKLAPLSLFQNAGAVTLDNVLIDEPVASAAIRADVCSLVAVRESTLRGTIRASFSRLFLDRCVVEGSPDAPQAIPPRPAGPAISSDRSTVSLFRTWVRGGRSASYTPPGILAAASHVLARGVGSSIDAGVSTRAGGHAFVGDAKSILRLDRLTKLVPARGKAAIQGRVTVLYREFPKLLATSPVAGRTLDFEIYAKAGSIYAVAVSIAGPAILTTSPEPLLLDLRSVALVGVGRQPNGARKLSVFVPRIAGLERLDFLAQGAQLDAGRVEFTNPVVLGVR